MRTKAFLALLLLLVTLTGCDLSASSPKDTLATVSDALLKNDSSLFLAQFDLKACAVSEIKMMTQANEALSTLDSLGRTLGLGGMEDLIGNVFDMEHALRQKLGRKTATGELVGECERAGKPGCPWIPKALRMAEVKTVAQDASLARVTWNKITTWVALARNGEKWRIVGWADLEDTAREFAQRKSETEGVPTPAQPKPRPERKPAQPPLEL